MEMQPITLDGIFYIKSYKPAQGVNIYYISPNINGT